MDTLIKATKHILARVFVRTQALTFLECVPRSGILGLQGQVYTVKKWFGMQFSMKDSKANN